jgi:hypothetical protein
METRKIQRPQNLFSSMQIDSCPELDQRLSILAAFELRSKVAHIVNVVSQKV